MEWYHYLLAIAGSALAGAINTLAGNGSAITLTILTELLGLPGNVANGTNRIGIFTQSAASTYVFYRSGRLQLSQSGKGIALTTLGALVGIWAATVVSSDQFKTVFRFLLVAMLVVMLVKPEKWLRETDTTRHISPWITIPVFLALGFYGGFIQMGMGIFFLAAMVLGARYSLTDSNAVKSAVVGLYTFLAILIFAWNGQVDWDLGALMAVGQTAGGYFTARFATTSPKANVWAHRVLIAVVTLAVAKMFNLHTLLLR
mgnify:CR=1 FL=1